MYLTKKTNITYKECRRVKNGEKYRICYTTALRALNACNMMNLEERKKEKGDETYKFHIARWCPECHAWHDTTEPEKPEISGAIPPRYRGDHETILAIEKTGTYRDILKISHAAEKILKDVNFVEELKPRIENVDIFKDNPNIICGLLMKIKNKKYNLNISEEERKRLYYIINKERLQYDITETKKRFNNLIDKLNSETDFDKIGYYISCLSGLEKDNIWMWNLKRPSLTKFYWFIEDSIKTAKMRI